MSYAFVENQTQYSASLLDPGLLLFLWTLDVCRRREEDVDDLAGLGVLDGPW